MFWKFWIYIHIHPSCIYDGIVEFQVIFVSIFRIAKNDLGPSQYKVT